MPRIQHPYTGARQRAALQAIQRHWQTYGEAPTRAELGRAFTGVERERRYFDIACERISRAQAQGQLLPPEPAAVAVQQTLELP